MYFLSMYLHPVLLPVCFLYSLHFPERDQGKYNMTCFSPTQNHRCLSPHSKNYQHIKCSIPDDEIFLFSHILASCFPAPPEIAKLTCHTSACALNWPGVSGPPFGTALYSLPPVSLQGLRLWARGSAFTLTFGLWLTALLLMTYCHLLSLTHSRHSINDRNIGC